MAKKRSGKPEQHYRRRLPEELETRLLMVWRKLGHLIDWCDDGTSWTDAFCSEARPYRETFYWEAVAEMVTGYIQEHPIEPSEDALADCLIATQSPACSDDPDRLVHFRNTWCAILDRSKADVEAFIEADLDLARENGIYEMVARLYAADHERWRKGSA